MTGRKASAAWAAPFLVIGPVAAIAPRSLVTLLLGAGVFGLCLHLLRRRRLALPDWYIVACLGLFIAYAGVSASWSMVPGSAVSQFFKLIYLSGAGLVCAGMLMEAPEPRRRAAARALALGTTLGAALLLADTVAGHSLLGALHGSDRTGAVGDPAANRSAVALAVFVWPAAFAAAGITGSAGALALPIGCLLILLLTTSQSAVLGVVAGLIVYAIACLSLKAARILTVLTLAIGLGAAVPIAGLAYSAGLSEAAWLPHSAQHRAEIWNFAAERSKRRPLFGFGLDASRAIPNEGDVSKFKSWTDKIIPLHPHNFFLQIWLELGAVGAALAFAVGAALLHAASRLSAASERFALATFMGNLAIAGVTSFSMWQTWWTGALVLSALSLLPSARRAPPAIDNSKGAI